MNLKNYEFNTIPGPDGNVEVRHLGDNVFILSPQSREFITKYIDMMKLKKPNAYNALALLFSKSRENRLFFEFQIVRRHIRCNFGAFDDKLDIDENGNFHPEYIPCPHCSECNEYGLVCNSNESIFSYSEMNVLRLIINNYSNKEISELLFISEHTVHHHRNNMMRKANVNNVGGLIKYWYENNLK